MQQEIVDSSKYKLGLLSLDSRYAKQEGCSPSDFKIVLPYPIKNVMRVRLASIELPLVEFLFSEQYGNLTMAVRLGANPNFVKITPIIAGNYTASELLAAIQARLQLIHSGFLVTIDYQTGQCTIRNTSIVFEVYMFSFNQSIARRPTYWGIGYYLGFRQGQIRAVPAPDGSYVVRGTSVVNTQQNQYYLLQLGYPEQIVNVQQVLQDDNFLEAFAKIVLKDGYYTIAFDDNSNLMRKEYTFLAPVTIPFFTIKLLNPFGEQVDMRGSDWSLTLEITEVVNSKTYTTISKTYART
jgi:hypothetical protein